MTVADLLEKLSAAELAEWMAFSNIEPLFLRRLDYVAALIAAVAGNPWRSKPLQVDDLMPLWEDTLPGGSRTVVDQAMSFAEAFGKARKDQKGKKPTAERKPKGAASSVNGGAKSEKTVHLRDSRNRPGRQKE